MQPISARFSDISAVSDASFIPAQLRDEIAMLDGILYDVLKECEGDRVLTPLARLRQAAHELYLQSAEGADPDPILNELRELDPTTAHKVARALTLHCQLLNLAEDRQRVRSLRAQGRDGRIVEDAIEAGIHEVIELEGSEAVEALIQRLRIHPVLTAHPTEARRRAVVDGLQRISQQLERLDAPEADDAFAVDVRRRLAEELTALWATAPFRQERPTPLDEVRRIMAVFDQTLFDLVPGVYREVERTLARRYTGATPPRTPAFLRYGSWVGGDRDGNPNVTAQVTRQAVEQQTEQVLERLERRTRNIARLFTASDRYIKPSEQLQSQLERDQQDFPEQAAALQRTSPDQPHRHKLVYAAERLRARRQSDPRGYTGAEQMIADLDCLQRSLDDAGVPRLAYGEIQDLRWQVATFRFHLAELELRQHSSIHAAAIEELAPGYSDDAHALDRLARDGWQTTPEPTTEQTQEVLDTLRTAAQVQATHGPRSCHRYIISFTRSAADLVAVRALARLAVPAEQWPDFRLDVVPLFETRRDLEHAERVLDEILQLPGERATLDERGNHLEVMVGYSDSAKDVGVFAANAVLHDIQERLANWARDNDINLTIFHGRGGSLGRGGGPLNRAIRGQAAGSVSARLKVTEQGEMIFTRYRTVESGRWHLERTTNAVLAMSTHHAEEHAARLAERYRDDLQRMSSASESAYLELVKAPGFAEFFARVTPYEEIGQLEIGSRPAHRSKARDLESLRAIPWVFSWSQSRINLAAWYGVGTGLAVIGEEQGGIAKLREMRREWPFFAQLLENVEMGLARADMILGSKALDMGEQPQLRDRILDEWQRTEKWVLIATGKDYLLERQPFAQASQELRRTDVDALSLLQLAALDQLRNASEQDQGPWTDLVKMTIAGLSSGLQNTG
ncbi:phosphoenolpyruvate carboxylase [Halorhodospira halochloris]|uniref:phosphoenolpyruvate carboxylase n=1 Tax=Halorhodospira halochloris TaxID=1052 RepID=UPI001EE78828|nr:phosphoenolpyruvate carboxylase [Halorhodospira halochloris]MCG5531001.1 phosphoenolpyruvate carboxylase [Halorhodospira halochloris]